MVEILVRGGEIVIHLLAPLDNPSQVFLPSLLIRSDRSDSTGQIKMEERRVGGQDGRLARSRRFRQRSFPSLVIRLSTGGSRELSITLGFTLFGSFDSILTLLSRSGGVVVRMIPTSLGRFPFSLSSING